MAIWSDDPPDPRSLDDQEDEAAMYAAAYRQTLLDEAQGRRGYPDPERHHHAPKAER